MSQLRGRASQRRFSGGSEHILHLAHITLVVRDYDEALAFYVGKLRFELVEDSYQPEQDKRWVTIRPPNAPADATTILLARAATATRA